MRRIFAWPLAGLFLVQAGLAHAACHPDGTANIYEGTIGKSPARIALIARNGKVEGKYAYLISTSDIRLNGTLDPAGKRLTLTEYDAAGHPTATFNGRFTESDPKLANGSPLNCEEISGKWTATGKAPIDFNLGISSSGATDLAHLYDAAGVSDDEVVNKAATAFRNAVAHDQKAIVAKMIVYPVRTSVNGKQTKIANAQALIADYDSIFTPKFRKAIAGDFTRLMFARDQGVMIGGGDVWFNETGKVIALNN
jgi:hypothetical protein